MDRIWEWELAPSGNEEQPPAYISHRSPPLKKMCCNLVIGFEDFFVTDVPILLSIGYYIYQLDLILQKGNYHYKKTILSGLDFLLL